MKKGRSIIGIFLFLIIGSLLVVGLLAGSDEVRPWLQGRGGGSICRRLHRFAECRN